MQLLKGLCLTLCLSFPSVATQAAEATIDRVAFTSLLEYTTEPENPSIDPEKDIVRLQNFKPLPKADGNLGFHSEGLWFRLQVPPSSEALQSRVLVFQYAPLDAIDFYIQRTDDSFTHIAMGDSYPFENRSFSYRLANVSLPTEPGPLTLYFRVKSESTLQIGGHIYSEKAFLTKQNMETLIFGLYYGGLLILAFYNLSIYFFLKEKIYLYYVLYVFHFLIFQSALNGTLYEYILTPVPWLNNFALTYGAFGFAFFLATFTRRFLRLSDHNRFNLLFLGFTWCQPVFFLLSLVHYPLAMRCLTFTGIVFPLLALIASIRQIRKGIPEAWDYAIAFAFFLVGTLAYGLKTLGFIPSFGLTEYSLQIGSLGEATLLSIALAHKINRLKNSVLSLNDKLTLEVAEKSKLFEELQQEMHDRVDLQEQSAIISFNLEGMRTELHVATQKLIQADKLATLGIMSAGVAHDIASPSNVIILNQQVMTDTLKKIQNDFFELLDVEEDPSAIAIKEQFRAYFRFMDESLTSNNIAISRIGEISRAIRNAARADAEPTIFSLVELIQETLIIIRSRTSNINIEFAKDQDLKLYAQRSQIGQVFMNLIVNAADAINTAQRPERRILILWSQDQGDVAIEVHDSGTGIPEDVRKKMGETFFTTKPKDKGTGLGMSIIARILHQHSGRLVIGNSPQIGGALMSLHLPKALASSEDIPKTH